MVKYRGRRWYATAALSLCGAAGFAALLWHSLSPSRSPSRSPELIRPVHEPPPPPPPPTPPPDVVTLAGLPLRRRRPPAALIVVPLAAAATSADVRWAATVAAPQHPVLLLQREPQQQLPHTHPHVRLGVAETQAAFSLQHAVAAWEREAAADGTPTPRFVASFAGAAPEPGHLDGAAADPIRRFLALAAAHLTEAGSDPGAAGCVLRHRGAVLAAGLLPGVVTADRLQLFPALEGVPVEDGRVGDTVTPVAAAHPGCAVMHWGDVGDAAAGGDAPAATYAASVLSPQIEAAKAGRAPVVLGDALLEANPGSAFSAVREGGGGWAGGGVAESQDASPIDFMIERHATALRMAVHADRARRATAALADTSRGLLGTTVMWDTYCGCTGVNIEAAAFLHELERLVAVRAVAAADCWCQGYPDHLRRALARMTSPKEPDEIVRSGVPESEQITIWVSHKPVDGYPTFPYRGVIEWGQRPDRVVGRSMIEVDRIPRSWVSKINGGGYVDEVWVPSGFQRDVFVNSGVRRGMVHVIPEAIDVHLYDPAVAAVHPALSTADGAPYRFLSNFKWEDRKGWDVLLKVYFDTFKRSDSVSLVLKTYLYLDSDPYNPDRILARVRKYAESLGHDWADLPHVQILSEEVPARDMPGVYAGCDCFVLPTRGEGWGLPMHEAMAMALPTIATNWGGNTHFMTKDTSLLLEVEGTVAAKGGGAFSGARWAEPSQTDLARKMRWVFEHRSEAKRIGRRAREHIVENFSQEAVGKVLLARVAAIRDELALSR